MLNTTQWVLTFNSNPNEQVMKARLKSIFVANGALALMLATLLPLGGAQEPSTQGAGSANVSGAGFKVPHRPTGVHLKSALLGIEVRAMRVLDAEGGLATRFWLEDTGAIAGYHYQPMAIQSVQVSLNGLIVDLDASNGFDTSVAGDWVWSANQLGFSAISSGGTRTESMSSLIDLY